MKKHYTNKLLMGVAIMAMMFLSCKKKDAAANTDDKKFANFSIKNYELDQWNTWHGEPFVILKTVTVDKKTDSSYTNSDTISWAPIFRAFAATDISDLEFSGKYNINSFEDPQDGTRNLFYQAKEEEEDLFTRKLLITFEPRNNMITGIYIETFKKYFMGEVTGKLYYSPMKTIQIQTDDKPLLGKRKLTVTEWNFLR